VGDKTVDNTKIDTTGLDLGNFNSTYYYKPITYSTENNIGTFTNGGTAKLEDNTITLDKITAGDKVTFSIDVKNNSDVAIQYRTVISCSGDTTLFSGLKFTVGDVDFSQVSLYKSAYKPLKVGEGDATVNISVELPLDAGNTYQNNKSTKITYAIEAVQGNADTSKGSKDYYEYAPVGAEGVKFTSENITTTDDGNGIILTSANIDQTATEVVIPSEVNGVPVTEIGEKAFYQNDIIESVIIPSSVTIIAEEAFDGCSNLKTVQLSKGLVQIGREAFYYTDLSSIYIPDTVKYINSTTFGIKDDDDEDEYEDYSFTVYYGGTQEQWNNIKLLNYGTEVGTLSTSGSALNYDTEPFSNCKILLTLAFANAGNKSGAIPEELTIYFESTGEDDITGKESVTYKRYTLSEDDQLTYQAYYVFVEKSEYDKINFEKTEEADS
jgi:hypothetical protein